MPEWLLAALAAAVVSAASNAIVAAYMVGQTKSVVSRLDVDVKDMQRNKLDKALHDERCERIDERITHVHEIHTEGRRNLDHKINGVSQRVSGLESKR